MNDKYGNEVGDRALCEVANALVGKCAANRTSCSGPYRFGGGTFCAVLTEVDAELAAEFAESLRVSVEQIRIGAYPELRLTARFAVVIAAIHEHGRDAVERYQGYLQGKAAEVLWCDTKRRQRNAVILIEGD